MILFQEMSLTKICFGHLSLVFLQVLARLIVVNLDILL